MRDFLSLAGLFILLIFCFLTAYWLIGKGDYVQVIDREGVICGCMIDDTGLLPCKTMEGRPVLIHVNRCKERP